MNNITPKEPGRSFSDTLKNGASLFVTLSPAFLVAFLVVRGMEFISLSFTSNLPPDFQTVVSHAILFDIITFLKMLPFLFVPFFLACFWVRSPRARTMIYGVACSIVIIAYTMLIKYFAVALVPLGSDLFGYSLKEIDATVRGGLSIDAVSVILFVVPVLLFWGGLAFASSRGRIRPLVALAIIAAGAVMVGTVSALPARITFETELSYNLALNKAAYFVEESRLYLLHAAGKNSYTVPRWSEDRRRKKSSEVDAEYPFLRADNTPDVLGKFFKITPARPPNIVFILVEGLGKAFSGRNAYLGSFTPFLDELAERSLYWENFLASQGRTFAALPSILGSLPFAEKGFSDLGERMPEHLSVMSILKYNGYRIKYYSGTDLDFDNERLFLQRQSADVLVGMDDYGKSYSKSPGTSWGYPDRELMRKALEMDGQDSRQPYVSFVQTMSMHSSYSIPDQGKYLASFEARMKKLGFDEAQKERHRAYKNIYATILYTDDALRYFFGEYAKLPAYGNTLFIITGDHRLPEIPLSTKIDRFHVPLIIFSPLLKHAELIESISSHLDIAPSLIAFLKKNYHLDAPSQAAWIGTGLDTDPSFRNIHHYPLKHTKTNLIDYISGMFFLDQDTLFSIGKFMDLEPVQDEGKKQELIAEFDRYKALNDRFTRELKLIPERMYKKYHP